MNGFLAFLVFLSMTGLVIGLINPDIFKKLFKTKTSRKTIWLSFGSLLVIFFILFGITAPKNTTPIDKSTTSTTASLQATKASNNTKEPVITTKTTTTTTQIPYTTSTVQDSLLAQGITQVQTKGVNGISTTTWLITYSNGIQTSKKQVSLATTKAPVNEVIDQGTYVAPTPTPQPTGCYPLSNKNTCYEPGEYCRTSDQGTSGVAGDGKAITCENNDGLRW